jgi:exodeoxyribonuclease VII large subunit
MRRRLILDALDRRLDEAGRRTPMVCAEQLARAVQGLEARSPLATLRRGYAILRQKQSGLIIRESGQVVPGDQLDARLAQGSLTLEVSKVSRGD